jgi:hypothetical protein
MQFRSQFTTYVWITSFLLVVIAGLFYFGYNYLKEKPRYKLTHAQGDAEYLLSWDLIGSHCPGVNRLEKKSAFVRRGETISLESGQSSLPKDSPQAWTSSRWAATPNPAQGPFHSFMVSISFFDSEETAEEYLTRIAGEFGIDVQEEGEFTTASHETLGPTKSRQAFLVGNHMLVTLDEIASSEEQFFCEMGNLRQIVSSAQKNILPLAITPLPPQIPALQEPTPLEWSEVGTIRSQDVPPYVKVPEGESYNEQWFGDRPLRQSFTVTAKHLWRLALTATGEVGTKVELRWTVTRPEGSVSESEVFQLSSQKKTLRPDRHLQNPPAHLPGNVTVEIYVERPMTWVVKIEEPR